MVLHTEADLASENVAHKGVVMSTIRKGRTLRPAPTQNSSSKSVLTSHEDCTQPRPTPLLSRCAGFVLCVLLALLVAALPASGRLAVFVS